MKRFYPFLVLLVAFVMGCQDVKHADKPDDLIPEPKMVDILTDLTKFEAARNYSRNEFSKREISVSTLIYQKYNIDSLQLAQSLAYYAEDFVVNDRIFDSVKTRLEVQKTHFDSIVEQEREARQAELNDRDPKKTDSIDAKGKLKVRLDSISQSVNGDAKQAN